MAPKKASATAKTRARRGKKFSTRTYSLLTRFDPYQFLINPFWPVLTRIEPCQNLVYILNWILFDPYRPVSTRFDPDVNLVIIRCMTAMRYTARVHKVLCCGLQRVDASQCGSNRVNTDINTELKSVRKFWAWPKIFHRRIVAPGIHQELARVTMRVNAGLYGSNRVDTVSIPYGPDTKSGRVWL